MRLNFDVVAMLRTQAKHNYIHSIPILTPHSDNAPNEEKAIPPQKSYDNAPQNHCIYINR